jgi:type I restriction enzyme M protein
LNVLLFLSAPLVAGRSEIQTSTVEIDRVYEVLFVAKSAEKERHALEAQQDAILAIEKRLKDHKTELKKLTDELEHKLQLKRLGGEEFKAETYALLNEADTRLAALDENDKEDKKEIAALQKDKAILEARISRTDTLLAAIGGQLTNSQAKTLILKKLYDLANQELNRYLNAEKWALIEAVENLWSKYSISMRRREDERSGTLKSLDKYLARLGYL